MNYFVLSRDPRFSNESLVFLQIIAQNATPESKTLDVQLMRQQLEDLSQLSNAKLNGTFKGNTEERIIKTDSAGRFRFLEIISSPDIKYI